MCGGCLELGLEPIVTLHHFTSPRWLAERGGWTEDFAAERFALYAERVTAHLGDVMGRVCTFNEPNVVATFGHLWGIFPRGKRNPDLRSRANEVFIDAHRRSVEIVQGGPGSTPVGLTLAMQDLQAAPGGEAVRDAERREMEDVYLEAARGDDFVGVQTYTRFRYGPDGMLPPPPGARTTQMGYEFWPEALEATIRRATEVTKGVPILVTENGIGTADDDDRIEYVTQALHGVQACLDDGIDVRGYVYWSLLDNFEWVLGYGPTFGLVAVDRTTQTRAAKPSAHWLGAIARANAV
jgi:beta-glucosidase